MNTNINKPLSDTPAPSRKQRSFKDRLRSNIPQKLIALLCSLILFIVVLGDRNKTLEFEKIPVEMRLPDGYVTLDNSTQTTVDVSINGRASLLRSISRDDIGVIRLSPPPRDGNIQVTLQPDMLNLPEGIHIDHFSPEFISINLEPLDHRTVAVTTDHAFTGELLPGYQLGEVKIQPESIEIFGPRSLIAETSQLYIEPIDLTGKASSFTVNRLVILNRVGLQTSSSQVKVTVNIVSTSRQHVVLGVPIIPLNLSINYEFVPSKVDLMLVGDEQALAKIDTSNLFITVDASKENELDSHARMLSAGDFSVPNLPSGVGFDESKLPSVLFKVWRNANDKPDN